MGIYGISSGEPTGSSGFLSKGGLGSDLLGYVPMVGGLLGSLFGKSATQQRQERIDNLLRQNQIRRDRALNNIANLKSGGIKDISKNTATNLGRTQADIARRAIASGRGGDVEGMMLPATANINEAGNKTMESALRYYDTERIRANRDFDTNEGNIRENAASMPLDSNWGTDLMNIGSQYFQYQQGEQALANKKSFDDKYLDILRGSNGGGYNVKQYRQPWEDQMLNYGGGN
jgi:hypothetical protein